MFRLQVERRFTAKHAIVIEGELEELHEHDWRVRVRVQGPRLDGEGLLCDFHDLEQSLDSIIAPFHGCTLNDTPPFDERNPTAELVAEHIGASMVASIPPGIFELEASVTEAPGCEATAMFSVPQAVESSP